MQTVTELDLPVLDYADPTLVGARFHAVMQGLRERSWLAAVDPLGYVLLDHEPVDVLLRTRRARMPAIEILELQGVTDGPMHNQLSGNLINLGGDEHRRLRALVQAPFLPKAAERLRPAMRKHVAALFDAVATDGTCEFVSTVAKPYPARMIAEIVGAPVSDAARLGEWAYWIQGVFDPIKVSGRLDRIDQAAAEFERYVRDLLAQPGDTDGDNLLATLRAARRAGELSEDACVHLVSSVLVGGVDTTQAQLAHAVRLFAEHPAQWAALTADPTLVPAAVEEVLRFEPITPFTARLVTEDFTHDEVTFPAGTLLIASISTANRDPEVYEAPATFDLSADRAGAALMTFGAGPHFCIGHALARAELEEAVSYLATRIDQLTLAGDVRHDTPSGVYGLLQLPIRFSLR